MLRQTFYHHAGVLLSAFMRCGVRCVDDVFSHVSGHTLKGGYIVVIQPRAATATTIRTAHDCDEWRMGGAAAAPPRHVPYRLLRKSGSGLC